MGAIKPQPRGASAPPPEVLAELYPGQSIALLQALHILTRDARLNQDSRRKLKQVNHLLQFIEPLLHEALQARGDVTLVDHGAGKSYLGFLLYDRFFAQRAQGSVWGVEARAELVERSAALAQRLGFARMHFVAATVREAMATLPATVDVVTALHACDTATDDAIDFALQRQAQAVVLVPCCQAEVAAVLRRHKALQLARTPLAELWRHPLHTRELGSQVTNVLRCLRLQASGYEVSVTELVGWEHSLKNELIIARRSGRRSRSAAQRLQRLLDELGLQELQARFAVAPI
ncbi:class I SAM-dependent methyltransferase [Tepidimonas charontis]|uniref:Methyltransferase domain protein n=1 Tax=Tepidimonas charontis TaxID=2267262 RepID=A0A554X1T9_9BURK|nr:SAM-dependent methyltransferase [Tepidimonas charontis]TSE29736.1 Methyltransferase domain protein [Tepidimonas charontis]